GSGGGPDLMPAGPVVTWVGAQDGRTYAAGLSVTGGVIVYAQRPDGSWAARDLTATIPGAEAVASQLGVMTGPDGYVHLTGLTASGDLVQYVAGPAPGADGLPAWAFADIARDSLAPAGEPMPRFVGNLVSFATSWNGLNVAGLDSGGDVWSVW